MTSKRVTLVCLNPTASDLSDAPPMPNFGIRRVQAALAGDPLLKDVVVEVIERDAPDLEGYVEAIAKGAPDVVGFTVYVWSFPFLVDVAREVRKRLPRATIVFGGPSSRPEMFALDPYADAVDFIDAVAIHEGEGTVCEILSAADRDRESLAKISGLAVPQGRSFIRTKERPRIATLDELPSPYALGLMPDTKIAHFETSRGCPMTCLFCEWGDVGWRSGGRVVSVDSLVSEFEAIGEYEPREVFQLDAGLNLNARAFQVLREAARRTGFFRRRLLITEIYPSYLTDEHLDFLFRCETSYLGVGLQSTNLAVLDSMRRPFDRARFETVIRQLRDVGEVELQIIFGLPTDTPEAFGNTLEQARSLGCAVRVYHCLVLPDALLSRGKPEFRLEFDPFDMKIIACAGWSREEIEEGKARLTAAAYGAGGTVGRYWWSFPARVPFTASKSRSLDGKRKTTI